MITIIKRNWEQLYQFQTEETLGQGIKKGALCNDKGINTPRRHNNI